MSATGVRLVADIGGTHARFAMFRQGDTEPHHALKLLTADYPDLVSAARAYVEQSGVGMPRSLCVAVAGPVDGDSITLTNNHWSFSPAAIRQALALDELHVINDFEAMAWAVTAVKAEGCEKIGGGRPRAGKPVGVIGPGTGFGAATLMYDSTGRAMVSSTEGGHASLAPCDERELAVFRWLQLEDIYPSRESLLSGSGLETIYRALLAIDGGTGEPMAAPVIQQAALENDNPHAGEALALFCAFLGTAAGDQALSCGALGGIYITGGIVRRFLPFLHRSRFRRRFEGHRPMQHYLENIPVYVVTARHQGLKGAALARV